MAEAIFIDKVSQHQLTGEIEVDSCGTSDYHIGERPDRRTISVLKKHGIEPASNARQLQKSDFEDFDYVIAMDANNLQHCQSMQQESQTNHEVILRLMRDYDELAPGTGVPDPYYGGPEGFDHVYELLDRSCDALLKEIGDKLKA